MKGLEGFDGVTQGRRVTKADGIQKVLIKCIEIPTGTGSVQTRFLLPLVRLPIDLLRTRWRKAGTSLETFVS